MYCKYCNSLVEENTTVCANCGSTLSDYVVRCSHCGHPLKLKESKKLKFKWYDFVITVLFFPLSIIYLISIINLRIETFQRCSHCNHIE